MTAPTSQAWLDEVIEPWRDPDRTIVVMDHTPRRDAQAGCNAGAIGSQTKTAAADVQYRVDAAEHDPVGRLVAATLTDTGSNAMWYPRAMGLAVARGVPTANRPRGGAAHQQRGGVRPSAQRRV